jgi:hypothetical protein
MESPAFLKLLSAIESLLRLERLTFEGVRSGVVRTFYSPNNINQRLEF